MSMFYNPNLYSEKATGKARIEAEPYGHFIVSLEVEEIRPRFWRGTYSEYHWRTVDEWGRWARPWWCCMKFDSYMEALVFLRWLAKKDRKQYYLEDGTHAEMLSVSFEETTHPEYTARAQVLEGIAREWIGPDHIGSSSCAIFMYMATGKDPKHSHPRDAGDRRRCIALLKAVPEWQARIPELGAFSPEWDVQARLLVQEMEK